MGQIHPILRDRLKLNQEAFLFEVNLEEIIKAINPSITKYKKLPQFPEVQRDLAFIVPKIISCEELQKAIKKSVQQNIFKNCEIFDVYQGEHIEKGFKSVAFRIKMQDEQATLTDEIIDAQMNSIKNNLEKTFEKLTFRV